jgi:hypothetical protein
MKKVDGVSEASDARSKRPDRGEPNLTLDLQTVTCERVRRIHSFLLFCEDLCVQSNKSQVYIVSKNANMGSQTTLGTLHVFHNALKGVATRLVGQGAYSCTLFCVASTPGNLSCHAIRSCARLFKASFSLQAALLNRARAGGT